ncbi:MAG: Hsp70 family protein, partial [Gallionella sp.]
ARNQLDALIHSTHKSLKEYGEHLTADEKTAIETALKDAEAVVKADDKEAITTKAEALATAAQKLGEKMYAAEQAKAQAGQAGAESGTEAKQEEGDVVDAEFTEVKDNK